MNAALVDRILLQSRRLKRVVRNPPDGDEVSIIRATLLEAAKIVCNLPAEGYPNYDEIAKELERIANEN